MSMRSRLRVGVVSAGRSVAVARGWAARGRAAECGRVSGRAGSGWWVEGLGWKDLGGLDLDLDLGFLGLWLAFVFCVFLSRSVGRSRLGCDGIFVALSCCLCCRTVSYDPRMRAVCAAAVLESGSARITHRASRN